MGVGPYVTTYGHTIPNGLLYFKTVLLKSLPPKFMTKWPDGQYRLLSFSSKMLVPVMTFAFNGTDSCGSPARSSVVTFNNLKVVYPGMDTLINMKF